jgi:hypothetical protein
VVPVPHHVPARQRGRPSLALRSRPALPIRQGRWAPDEPRPGSVRLERERLVPPRERLVPPRERLVPPPVRADAARPRRRVGAMKGLTAGPRRQYHRYEPRGGPPSGRARQVPRCGRQVPRCGRPVLRPSGRLAPAQSFAQARWLSPLVPARSPVRPLWRARPLWLMPRLLQLVPRPARRPQPLRPAAGGPASARRAPPAGGRGRLGLPRCSRNGSSHRCPFGGKGQGLLCWRARAHEPARKPGFSSASCPTVPFFARLRRGWRLAITT